MAKTSAHNLRNVEDANKLTAAAEKAETVILIGASFISMEAASAFRERGLSVTIVSEGSVPLLKQLGPEMGQLLLEKHLQKGVRFLAEAKIVSIDKLVGVNDILSNNKELRANGGQGCRDRTGNRFSEKCFTPRRSERTVVASMRIIGASHIFAAGDVANFPLIESGRRTRIEHWRVAQEQARTAAANKWGWRRNIAAFPIFGLTLRHSVRIGRLPDQSQLVIDGDLKEPTFVAAYVRDGRCEAIFSANRECETAKIFDLMQNEGPPSLETFHHVLSAS